MRTPAAVFWCLLLLFPVQRIVRVDAFTGTYGINYGRIADNIPAPENVVSILKAIKIKNVKIFDSDHGVLKAFKGSGLELVVGLSNDYVKEINSSEDRAMEWVKDNVQSWLPDTKITGIAVGNEVLGGETWSWKRPSYKSDPEHINLSYALFLPNAGIVDPKTNLHYDNMFDATIDAAYTALEAAGYGKMEVEVTETGWASSGDEDETGATAQNARIYNFNLRKRLFKRKGTPLRPKVVMKAYVFALFNEDLKPGPGSERHYGLFKADGSISYDIGFSGLSNLHTSSSPSTQKEFYAGGWLAPNSLVLFTCIWIAVHLYVRY
ncbi:hypothetical protein HPP92_022875 [Vanilla planifolia]|uniref:Glucan endo-1,3-beta-D-glucosidase n=1 Tax=Vanilla planifolia TaxID=51239 RepID=A0A835Q1F9_VANPL|nr:hypothetical protein HPP92_022875 [Vanilla planifolia]